MNDFKSRRNFLAASGVAALPILATTAFGQTIKANSSSTSAANGQVYMIRNGVQGWFQPNIYNVIDFGADPTGSADSTAAIIAAIDAMSSSISDISGSTLYFPAGTYLVSSEIQLKQGTYIGDGPYQETVIINNSPTANTFYIPSNTYGVTIKGFFFTESATKTSGAQISGNGIYYHIEDCMFDKFWHGVELSGSVGCTIHQCRFQSPQSQTGSVGISLDNNCGDIRLDKISMYGTGGSQAAYGVFINTQAGYITLTDMDVVQMGSGIFVQASAPTTAGAGAVNGIYAVNVGVDSGNNTGWTFQALDKSSLRFCHLIGCWSGTNRGYGILFNADGSGTIDSCTVQSCHVVNNSNHGILLNTNVSNINIDGCVIANAGGLNICGVYVVSSVNNFSVRNCRIGNVSVFSSFTYGVFLGGNNVSFFVTNNDLQGNGASLYLGPSLSKGVIEANLGYNPVGGGSISAGSSPWTYIAGSSPETHYIYGGNVSLLSTLGVTIPYNSSGISVHLEPNESYLITYSIAPEITRIIH